MYEPCHGSAPDIAGQGVVNPSGNHPFGSNDVTLSGRCEEAASTIEAAVGKVLDQGLRIRDIASTGAMVVPPARWGGGIGGSLISRV